MNTLLKPVTIETVEQFADTSRVTTSYLQADKHSSRSERYHAIQPASVGSVLAQKGYNLISLITGRAKHEDKANFQRTISRYRSNEPFEIDGLSLDIIYVGNHMGRGCDELILGFYRGVCANQWNVGTNFEVVKVRHSANANQVLSEGIDKLLEQRAKLIETIQKMRSTQLTSEQVIELAKKFATIRLGDVKDIVSIDHTALLQVHRDEDKPLDLFTVSNVLQENALRSRISYTVHSKDKHGNSTVRNMTSRIVRESSTKMVDLNGQFFDEALKLVA